jgi:hypothetical protein
MPRQCKLTYSISGADPIDISTHGFYLVKSDDRVIPPIKKYEEQSYPEHAASEIYPYTSYEGFDYSCTLLAVGEYNEVVPKVKAFWDSLFDKTEEPYHAHQITLFNYWKGVKVSGYAMSAEAESSHPRLVEYEKSAFLFNFVIRVSDPTTLVAL